MIFNTEYGYLEALTRGFNKLCLISCQWAPDRPNPKSPNPKLIWSVQFPLVT